MRLVTDCPDALLPGLNILPDDPVEPELLKSLLDHGQIDEPVTQAAIDLKEVSPFTTLLAVRSAEESQFDRLLNAGMELPHGLAAIALEGQRFHGQRGRPWSALAGNIHLSVLLHPQKPVQHFGAALTLVPSLAAFNTLKRLNPSGDAGIKWVNDVLISNRKVSGVIAATRLVSANLQSVVFGIGMNVETVPEITATPFVPAASSIEQEWSLGLSWNEVLPTLLQELARAWRELDESGAEKILEDYTKTSLVIGRDVVICGEEEDLAEDMKPIAQGRVVDILPDLSLVLEGQPDPVSRGRLAFV